MGVCGRILLCIVVLLAIAFQIYKHMAANTVATVRTANSGINLMGKKALVVGATSGIGRGIARTLARSGVTVIVVGRNTAMGATVVGELEVLKPGGGHTFLQLDASLLGNVKTFCDAFKANHDKLDYLVMTAGIATTQGRTETAEGLDVKMALHYYARMALAECLTPLLEASSDGRVLSVLSAGIHAPYAGYKEDPDLKEHYTLKNAADACTFYNDLGVDGLAARHPTITYVHAAPGFVNTNWGTEMPTVLRWLIRGVQFLGKSMDDCGEFMVYGLVQPQYKGGWHLLSETAEPAKPTPLHSDEARDFIWDHTKVVLDRHAS